LKIKKKGGKNYVQRDHYFFDVGDFSPEGNKGFVALLKEKLRRTGLWWEVVNPLWLSPVLIITKDEIDEIANGLDRVSGEIEKLSI
jgi:adenosylmethionine-8-amino-7-oxononanoate aminotransferase